jgi:hypothetical protein
LLTFIRWKHYKDNPGWSHGATLTSLIFFVVIANAMFLAYCNAPPSVASSASSAKAQSNSAMSKPKRDAKTQAAKSAKALQSSGTKKAKPTKQNTSSAHRNAAAGVTGGKSRRDFQRRRHY